jgi:hypothetical protein
MILFENERNPTRSKACNIATKNCLAGAGITEFEVSGFDGEICADSQADQIISIRHGIGLIEVIDSPYQPAFAVTPGSEVLDVEITHREHDRCSR